MRRGSKPAKAKPKVAAAKPAVAGPSRKHEDARVRDLEKLLAEALTREAEALEQQTATAEILRAISASPTDVQPVFDALVRSAVRLCGGEFSIVLRFDGQLMHFVAHQNVNPDALAAYRQWFPRRADDDRLVGRVIIEQRVMNVADVRAEFRFVAGQQEQGFRSVLFVPIIRGGVSIGVIGVSRMEVGAFPEHQVALLQTFADQAVIAIENVRLFNETKEALEQQTATAEILRVISSSPTDVQPVFDSIAESAARLFSGLFVAVVRFDGGLIHLAAQRNFSEEGREAAARAFPLPPSWENPSGRVILERRALNVPDIVERADFQPALQRALGYRSYMAVPMLREDQPIGAIAVTRGEVKPFSEREVALLQTFAEQAVIAIENVRLFQEVQARNRDLTEALEQQTATSEVLKVISRSTFDLQPVLETLIESAVRLCGADSGEVYRQDGDLYRAVACGVAPQVIELSKRYPIVLNRESATGRAVLERRVVHIPDTVADPDYKWAGRQGPRTVLVVPMLREAAVIGLIAVHRVEAQPFTDKQIELVTTFADQAVIAIENIRLFTELQEKNRALTAAHAQVTESLEQQTATGEVLKVISRSTFDLQPVLDTLIENATRLCGARRGAIMLRDGNSYHGVAFYNVASDLVDFLKTHPVTPGRHTITARVALERRTIHVADLQADPEYRYALRDVDPIRTELGVPMLRGDDILGVIILYKLEVQAFTDKQIGLVETFADQAVIAVENVRLFGELQTRNAELTESLEQQIATAEILRVIASSPTDLQPVMEAVAENAARVCGATDSTIFRLEGEHLRLVARHGSLPRPLAIGDTLAVSRGYVVGRAVGDRRTIHVADLMAAEADFPATLSRLRQTGSPIRTMVATPLLREGTPLGVIAINRGPEAHPFSAKQIALLETFADQAVIAIENVRLFQELRVRTAELTRSVGQLTALGEVSRAVSSTLDLDGVLQMIVSRASPLAGADGGAIYEYDEATQLFHVRATHEVDAALVETLRAMPLRKGEGAMGRAAETREPIQIADIAVPGAYESHLRDVLIGAGYRALLSVPLLREHQIIGSLSLNRKAPGAFAPEVIEVLKTFATQSALAIQNARLFGEIAEKGRELETASRHKSEFLANMSHELRTPLNAIIGFSEVLAEQMFGDVNQKQAEYLQDILASGRHLLSLINDILDLSKVEAGRLELELSQFHLPTALDNALTLVRERATRHGITLTQTVDPGVGDIVADERKVKQILLNLLSNAVKFTPERGQVGLTATPAEGVIAIAVSDTGVGIAPEDQAAIFEEFRQVGQDGARKQEGTGLGLTLTKKFVELHGGRIWVQSQMGQGSTFTFTLPVRPGGSIHQGGG